MSLPPSGVNVKVNTEKLAEKIVAHIKNDLEALFSLGDVKLILKSGYGKDVINEWVPTIDRFIQEAMKNENKS